MFPSDAEGILGSGPAVAILAGAAVRAALLLVVAAAIGLLLHRRSAAVRHLVWTLALAGCLLVPALTAILPRWSMQVPAAWTFKTGAPLARSAPAPAPEFPIAEQPLAYRPASGPMATGEQDPRAMLWSGGARSAPLPHMRPTMPLLLPGQPIVWIWLAGVALGALPIALGGLSLWRLRRSAREAGSRLGQTLLDLAREARIGRPVRLMLSPHRTMPMTWGIRRPVILLPVHAEAWPSDRLRAVLFHELAHIKRGDCLVLWLAQLVRALYWFNPLAWLAAARVRVEQERACDDLAIWRGLDPVDYADHLLAITTGFVPRRAAAAIAPAASRIETRLRSILDPAPKPGPLSRSQMFLASVVGIGLLTGVASSRLTSAAVPISTDDETFLHTTVPAATAGPAAGDAEEELLTLIRKRYIRPVDEKSLREGALKGIVEALHDPFSEYLTAAKLANFQRQVEGKVTGIGAQLETKEGQPHVIAPLPGSPALEAGLRPGDTILEVDGKPTKEEALSEVVKRIVGEAGTQVRLRVRHEDGPEVEMAITRKAIAIPTIVGFRLDRDGHWRYELDPEHHVDYIQIVQFAKLTAEDAKQVVQKRLEAGMKGLILDLRGSPGGMLEGAVDVAQLFLAKGTIVTTRGRDGEEKVFQAEADKSLGDFPLVVLVNEQTASAAEILAGALKENQRAVLVGSRTFGKGTVQALVTLEDGKGAARLTVGKYLLPSGRSLDRHDGGVNWGVDPDDGYFVPISRKQFDALAHRKRQRELMGGKNSEAITPERLASEEADPQLAAALQTLLAKLETGQFVKTGRSSADLIAQVRREVQAQERRQELLRSLEELDKELEGLVRPGSAPPH